jgi:hypothetical protein
MSRAAFRAVNDCGWVVTQTRDLSEFIKLSESLGQPTPSRRNAPIVDELRPLPRRDAKPASLSCRHGLEALPLHTDTAHWRIPARYVLLRAANEECLSRSTLIFDFRSLSLSLADAANLRRAMFSARNGRNGFLCPIISDEPSIIRLDAGCMSPTSKLAAETLNILQMRLAECYQYQIHWKQGDTLILDNWRFLHGRSPARSNDAGQRLLQRILVNNPAKPRWP